jgi:cysteine desulfurase
MMPVYLDYNATAPVLPEVLQAMLPFLRADYGNPSSSHALGRRAHEAVATARAEVAALIGAEPDEIVFTSGGTEASNIAIRGTQRGAARRPIVTSVLEHPATEEPCRLLAEQGHAVRRIRARADGRIDTDAAIAAIRAGAGLVTLIHAQNETGVLQPVAEIAAAAHENGALVHADAAQSVGKIALEVDALGVDLLSIAGHKLYAPKGIGALYVRRGTPVQPVLRGAGQERGLRPGTENVASMVAPGDACRLAALPLRDATHDMRPLAAALLDRLQRKVPGLALVGHPTERLPNTLNVLFPGVSGRAVLAACPDVMASTGSACHADREEASGVLRALGIAEKKALGAVRLSLGILTTAHEVEIAADALAQAWRAVARGHAPAPREVTTARP